MALDEAIASRGEGGLLGEGDCVGSGGDAGDGENFAEHLFFKI